MVQCKLPVIVAAASVLLVVRTAASSCTDQGCDVPEDIQVSLLQAHQRHESKKASLKKAYGSKPHIVFVLADDLGYTNIGFSAKLIANSTQERIFEAEFPDFTPTFNALADDGVVLRRHYTYVACTPSRKALLTGRLPAHLGLELGEDDTWDGVVGSTWGYNGISPNITTIAHKLKGAGYATHLVGKADGLGAATPQHQPASRGFDSSYVYHSHGNDYWNYRPTLMGNGAVPPCLTPPWRETLVYDLWKDDAGVTPEEIPPNTIYEEDLFIDRALDVIKAHDPSTPLFLLYASHLVHTPLQVPDEDYDYMAKSMCGWDSGCLNASGSCTLLLECDSIDCGDPVGVCALQERIQVLTMMHMLDANVGRIKDALVSKGMWDNTLIVFSSDNGGGLGGGVGGNNFPLRGGKGGIGSDWEGAMRSPALISGPVIPYAARGTVNEKLMHIADWWSTFCYLAGVDSSDPTVETAGMPQVDSLNMWGAITDKDTPSPRTLLYHSPQILISYDEVSGHLFKLLVGTLFNTMYAGPNYPNSSCPAGTPANPCRPINPAPIGPQNLPYDCGDGCLFDITADETESVNLNETMPELARNLSRQLDDENGGYFEPFLGCELRTPYCDASVDYWNLSYGTFINQEGCDGCIHTTAGYENSPLSAVPETSNPCQCATTVLQCARTSPDCQWKAGACDIAGGGAGRLSLRGLLLKRGKRNFPGFYHRGTTLGAFV